MTAHPERSIDYLRHILEAIDRAIAYAEQAGTLEAFEADPLVQDGVIRNIGVIGEAAAKIQRIDPELIASHSDVPWKSMQTMRHKVVHDYFDIDFSIVWRTVGQELPKLAAQIRQIVANQPDAH